MKKDILLSFLSALLLIFSFPPFNFWIFAWFSFMPLFFSLTNKSFIKSFFLSYLVGLIFFAFVLSWITCVTFLGYVLLVLYLSIYFGIFGIFFKILQKEPKIFIFSLASGWVILEYLRAQAGSFGFNWAGLAHSQFLNLGFIQIVDFGGSYLVSFILILINVLIWQYLKTKDKKRIIFPLIGLIVLVYSYGFIKLKEPFSGRSFRVSSVQPNIPQELKRYGQEDFILSKTLKLSKLATQDKPDLILWPEASFPGYWDIDLYLQRRILNYFKNFGISLLLGGTRVENYPDSLFYNSAILVLPDATTNVYNKIKLVPFGEYIPLKKIFGFLETIVFTGSFTPGTDYTVFSLTNLPNQPKFSVLICFEDTFSQVTRTFVKKGAQFLINITNDAWFKKTTSPYQHLQSSVLRAVENRRFVVRSANTGISCFINSKGKIFSYVQDKHANKIFTEGYKTEDIYLNNNISFYTKFGDWLVLLALIFLIYVIIKINLTRNEPRSS